MKAILIILNFIIFTACTNKSKFKYVENVKERVNGSKSLYQTTEHDITAANDTLAYIEAYNKFKISQRITHELLVGGSNIPKEIISFQLFNSEGKNITDVTFNTKAAEQKKADSIVATIDLSYKISTGK